MLNLNWITRKHFDSLIPRSVNAGNCYNWAFIAYSNYINVQLFTIDEFGGHAFIKIGARYYDAQNPIGVAHWSQLSMIWEMGDYMKMNPREQSLAEFLLYWYDNGKNLISFLESMKD